MKLSENQYNHFKVLLDTSELMNESELAIQEKVVPGVINHGLFVLSNKEVLKNRKVYNKGKNKSYTSSPDESGFSSIKHHSLERNPELVEFVQQFKTKHHILLDLIYTGKMLFGLFDMIKNSYRFDNKTIVVVHTGGIQGNKGFEERLNIII